MKHVPVLGRISDIIKPRGSGIFTFYNSPELFKNTTMEQFSLGKSLFLLKIASVSSAKCIVHDSFQF